MTLPIEILFVIFACAIITTLAVIADRMRPMVDEADIAGTYGGSSFGRQIVILSSDGTYNETYLFTSGNAYRNSGRWSYGVSDGKSYVLIENAFIGLQGEPPERRNWTLRAFGPSLGLYGGYRLELGDPDESVVLVKIAGFKTPEER